MRFGVQDPPMSAGPPDSRRALSSGLFASYSMGLASPLDIRARRKIIVRSDVEIIWAPIYRKDWTRATQWTDLSIRLPPFCGASRATGSSLGRRNLCPGRQESIVGPQKFQCASSQTNKIISNFSTLLCYISLYLGTWDRYRWPSHKSKY